jgi:hypothetical protein
VEIGAHRVLASDPALLPDDGATVQQIGVECHGVEPGHAAIGISAADREHRPRYSIASSSALCRVSMLTTISDTLCRVFLPSSSWPPIRRMLRRIAACRRAFNNSAGMS